MNTNETNKCEHCDTCKGGACCTGCGMESKMCSGKGCHSGKTCMIITLLAVIAAFFIGMWVSNMSMRHHMRQMMNGGMMMEGMRMNDDMMNGKMPMPSK